jgi:hypothetical protein
LNNEVHHKTVNKQNTQQSNDLSPFDDEVLAFAVFEPLVAVAAQQQGVHFTGLCCDLGIEHHFRLTMYICSATIDFG